MKPCPFCGSHNTSSEVFLSQVVCLDCSARGPVARTRTSDGKSIELVSVKAAAEGRWSERQSD